MATKNKQLNAIEDVTYLPNPLVAAIVRAPVGTEVPVKNLRKKGLLRAMRKHGKVTRYTHGYECDLGDGTKLRFYALNWAQQQAAGYSTRRKRSIVKVAA